MAVCRYSRKKVYRLFTVKFGLVGVPLIWLIFILLTLYYTQTMEKLESRKQLIFSAEQSHSQISLNKHNETVFAEANQVYIQHELRIKNNAQLKKVTPFLKHQKMDILQRNETWKHNRKRGGGIEAVNNKTKYKNTEHKQNVLNDKDLAAYMNQTSTQKFAQSHLHLVTAGTEYFEFVWKGDKPKPRKVSITEGKRFDRPKLGEHGTPVKIVPEKLTKEQREKYEDGWKKHQFNEYVSLQISTQRQTPDYRPEGCTNTDQISTLPKASVIICFYNEAWTVLIRTVYSVLMRSPSELIEEVILVDDYSDFAMMGEPLEYYVTHVDKLRLLRMNKRSGLVKARLAGVKEAKGPILIFLDSHVECAEGWLTPLLQSILENPNYAVTPEIDVIDHRDFAINAAVDNIGIFEFESFQFDWSSIMPRIKRSRKSAAEPFKSPTMAGGLFAIRKDYFISIGTYDPGLEVWGGENIELSLKLWMCGGGILIQPCSRVAHIFRDESPYLLNKSTYVLSKNSARVAQVWIDEYRKLYFKKGHYDEKKYGSVQERLDLRKRLQCHTFSWYLENIYPEMYIAGSGRFLGKIKSATGLCISSTETTDDIQLILMDCGEAHIFESTRIKEIRSSSHCLGADLETSYLSLTKCDLEDKTQTFIYTEKSNIHHVLSNNCLAASRHSTRLTLKPCSDANLQKWNWPKNFNFIP